MGLGSGINLERIKNTLWKNWGKEVAFRSHFANSSLYTLTAGSKLLMHAIILIARHPVG